MKKMYWQAHRMPRFVMLILCLTSLFGLYVVEWKKVIIHQKDYVQKIAAARLAHHAFLVIQHMRHLAHVSIDHMEDPQGSGLIGARLTNITTDQGDLLAKQISINPNISAVFVSWFKTLKLHRGDVVAVGMTGSFPALNINLLAAMQILGLKPLMVCSIGASQYGANLLHLTWIDMYARLVQEGVFNTQLLAVSLGGIGDRARGLGSSSRTALRHTIHTYHYPFLNPRNMEDAITQRMMLYTEAAKGVSIKAYINIGGGAASIGLRPFKNANDSKTSMRHSTLKTGLVEEMPVQLINFDSVAIRFLKQGVPVINMRHMSGSMREQYQLSIHPSPIGTGIIFSHQMYNVYWATGVLLVLITVLVLIRFRGTAIYPIHVRKEKTSHPD